MARKPTISPTKITTYLACPVKYRWTYLDGRGKMYLRAKSYYSFGSTLHRVLERFHGGDDAGVETTAEVAAAYEESWIDAGFSSAEEMSEAYHDGLEMLERHVEDRQKRAISGQVLFVERTLRLDMGRFDLLGRIDRVDEHADGTLEIVDYKTGRDSVTSDEVAEDIAMGCYQLLLAHAYPGRPIVATIHALRTGRHASASLSDLDDFREDVRILGNRILDESGEAYDWTPRLKRLCQGCDFLPLCRRHPEFPDELEMAKAE